VPAVVNQTDKDANFFIASTSAGSAARAPAPPVRASNTFVMVARPQNQLAASHDALAISMPRPPFVSEQSAPSYVHQQLRWLCGVMLQDLKRHPSRAVTAFDEMLECMLTAAPSLVGTFFDVSLFERSLSLRIKFAHATVEYSALPATFFELFHALHADTALSNRRGDTLAHALMRNSIASQEQKEMCLRHLMLLGCDLTLLDADGCTPAIVAARQKHDPYTMLSAIRSWNTAAFTLNDRRGISVADTLLANPKAHIESFKLSLCMEQMSLNADWPKAWQPPLLPLHLARYLPALLAKPAGAVDADGNRMQGL
jgi:hypothetical protein